MIPAFSMASSGRDFDPRTRAFSDEELKPQPMIKKSRKQVNEVSALIIPSGMSHPPAGSGHPTSPPPHAHHHTSRDHHRSNRCTHYTHSTTNNQETKKIARTAKSNVERRQDLGGLEINTRMNLQPTRKTGIERAYVNTLEIGLRRACLVKYKLVVLAHNLK